MFELVLVWISFKVLHQLNFTYCFKRSLFSEIQILQEKVKIDKSHLGGGWEF